MHGLYIELVKLQKEIIASGLKVLLILEGRDAAGKDGTVKRITRHLSPRDTRVVALGKPNERETGEWYFQRYVHHLPTAGEFVIFNRSWYNRAGVEKVMHFCDQRTYENFLGDVALFEQMLVNSGIILLKYYLDISMEEQGRRLENRREDPLRQWKISPIDERAQELWDAYSDARNEMLLNTSYEYAPWNVADAESKSKLHIALIRHLLGRIDYRDRREDLMTENVHGVIPVTGETVPKQLYA